jgi:hypothetical protein
MMNLRWAMALAAAVVYAGCGGSGCGGGGTNINSNSTPPYISCGPGTQQEGNTCVLAVPVNSH